MIKNKSDYTNWDRCREIEEFVTSIQKKSFKNLFDSIGKVEFEKWKVDFLKVKSVIEEENLKSFKPQDSNNYFKCLLHFLNPDLKFAEKIRDLDIFKDIQEIIKDFSDKHIIQIIFYEIHVKMLNLDNFKTLLKNFNLFTPSFRGFIIKKVIKENTDTFEGVKNEDMLSEIEDLLQIPIRISPFRFNIESLSDLIFISYNELYKDVEIKNIMFNDNIITKLDEIHQLSKQITFIKKFGELWDKSEKPLQKLMEDFPDSETILKIIFKKDENIYYLLSFIKNSPEKIKEFLKISFIPDHMKKFHMEEDKIESLDGTHLLPFIWDDSNENKEYKEIQTLILKNDVENSKKVILKSNKNNMRMYLLLICYHDFFLNKKQCETLSKIFLDQKVKNYLSITHKEMLIYQHYIKGPIKNYSSNHGIFAYQFSEALIDKGEENLITTHILTNILAVTLALEPTKNHLYRRTYETQKMHFKYASPGSVFSGSTEKDCGYQTNDGGKLITAPNILNQNILYHASLNTLTWGAFSCSLITDENNDVYNAMNQNMLVVGDWQTDIKKNLSDKVKLETYVFRRVEGFMGNVKESLLNDKNRYGHYFTISLYNLWKNHSKFSNPKAFFERFDETVTNYENDFRDICFSVAHNKLDEWLNQLRQKIYQSNIQRNIETFSLDYNNHLSENTLFPSIDQLKDYITQKENRIINILLNTGAMKSLVYLPKFIHLYHSLYTNLNKKIQKNDLNLEMKEILKNYKCISNEDWDEFKSLWKTHSDVLLNACSQAGLLKVDCRNVLEKEITYDDNSLLNVFLNTSETPVKDHFIFVLDAIISVYNKLQISSDDEKHIITCRVIQDPKTQKQMMRILAYPFEKFDDLPSLSHIKKREYKDEILEKMILMMMNRPKIQNIFQSKDHNPQSFQFKTENIIQDLQSATELGFHQDWEIHKLSSYSKPLKNSTMGYRIQEKFQNSLKDKSDVKKKIIFLNRIFNELPNHNIHTYLHKILIELKNENKGFLTFTSSLEKLLEMKPEEQTQILKMITEDEYRQYLKNYFSNKTIKVTINQWSKLFNEKLNQNLKDNLKVFEDIPIDCLKNISEILINSYLENHIEFSMFSGDEILKEETLKELEKVEVKKIISKKDLIQFLQDIISFMIKSKEIQNPENFSKSIYSKFYDSFSPKLSKFDNNEKEILSKLIPKSVLLSQFKSYIKFLNKLLGNLTLDSYNELKNCYQEDVPDFSDNKLSMETIKVKKIGNLNDLKIDPEIIIEDEKMDIENEKMDIEVQEKSKPKITKEKFNEMMMKPNQVKSNISILIPDESKKSNVQTNDDYHQWDVDRVSNFISEIDKSFIEKNYPKLFKDNNIDGQILDDLSKDDLKGILITPIGDQKKILKAIENLKGK